MAKSAAAAATIRCPMFRERITPETCIATSSIAHKNRETCSAINCPSRHRRCLSCVLQGHDGPDAVVVDGSLGLCDFHLEMGEDVDRRQAPKAGKRAAATRGPELAGDDTGRVVEIPTDRVRPFKGQPRTWFDPAELKALEASIANRGQLQPGLVRRLAGDPRFDYELIDGQRRWHACRALRRPYRAIVTTAVDLEDQFEQAITINFQRADHTPMEIARAIDRLCTKGDRTETYVATLFGRTSTWVGQYRRLMKLDARIQAELEPPGSLSKDSLPVSTAIGLAALPKPEQMRALREIRKRGLRTMDALELIRNWGRGADDDGTSFEVRTRSLGPAKQREFLLRFFRRTAGHSRTVLRRLDLGKLRASEREQFRAAAAEAIDGLAAIRDRLGEDTGERAR